MDKAVERVQEARTTEQEQEQSQSSDPQPYHHNDQAGLKAQEEGNSWQDEEFSQSKDSLTAQKRWDDALLKHKLDITAASAATGDANDPKSRWKRGAVFASQLSKATEREASSADSATDVASPPAHENKTSEPSERTEDASEEHLKRTGTLAFQNMFKEAKTYAYHRDPSTGKRVAFPRARGRGKGGEGDGRKAVKLKKELEEQHWLELIDPMHRYGSNMKYYLEEWKSSVEAEGNFFFWLDHGGGKDLSLPKCPREKLEAEKVMYLSVEQRRHYKVTVDSEGRFRWANPPALAVESCKEHHPFVDTTARKWTDLGDGRGCAPSEAAPEAQAEAVAGYNAGASSASSSVYSSDSSSSSGGSSAVPVRPGNLHRSSSTSVTRPAATQAGGSGGTKKGKEKGDTWMYVSDPSYNIYVGIKQKGRFQHSSFLGGGPITSAGTLVVREGRVVAISPHSGHYRVNTKYFKAFVDELEAKGVDLEEVKIGKTELKLWFIERANTWHTLKGKTRRLKKDLGKKLHIGT